MKLKLALILALILVIVLNRQRLQKTVVNFCPRPPTTSEKALNFRTGLEGNYRENLVLLLAATRRIYDSDPHAQDAIGALDDNTWDLGFYLQNLYGPDTGQKFTTIWQEQNKAFINYTIALKNHDVAAKAAAVTEIQNYLDHKVDFWKGILPHLDTTRYRRAVTARSDSVRSAIDAYATGDVAKSYREQHSAYQQTGQVANTLSDIIIQELPEKFSQ